MNLNPSRDGERETKERREEKTRKTKKRIRERRKETERGAMNHCLKTGAKLTSEKKMELRE